MEKFSSVNKRKRIPRAKSGIEKAVWQCDGLVCGVDEVGRGCLAGPVVTAAVVLHPRATFALLKDSKILTKEQRNRAARWIKEHSWYAYGVADHREIDRCNIYQATLHAMERAVTGVCANMSVLPAKVVVDAMPLVFQDPLINDISVEYFPFAEQRSISVAAASILAKVKRDALMDEFEKLFPGYALALHKGYATSKHCSCVAQLGRSIIHRVSFCDHVVSHLPSSLDTISKTKSPRLRSTSYDGSMIGTNGVGADHNYVSYCFDENQEVYEQSSIFCRSDRELPDAF